MPFSEVLDWKHSAVMLDERQLLQVPYVVRQIPPSKLLSLRLNTKYMWNAYFSSISRIIFTTLQVRNFFNVDCMVFVNNTVIKTRYKKSHNVKFKRKIFPLPMSCSFSKWMGGQIISFIC